MKSLCLLALDMYRGEPTIETIHIRRREAITACYNAVQRMKLMQDVFETVYKQYEVEDYNEFVELDDEFNDCRRVFKLCITRNYEPIRAYKILCRIGFWKDTTNNDISPEVAEEFIRIDNTIPNAYYNIEQDYTIVSTSLFLSLLEKTN